MWRLLFLVWTLACVPLPTVALDAQCIDGQGVFSPTSAFVFDLRGPDNAIVKLRLTQTDDSVKWQAFVEMWRCKSLAAGAISHNFPVSHMFAFLLEHYGVPSTAFESFSIEE